MKSYLRLKKNRIKRHDSWAPAGWNSIPWFHCPFATVQNLTPSAVNSARWQQLCQENLGFTFVQREEVVASYPFLDCLWYKHMHKYDRACKHTLHKYQQTERVQSHMQVKHCFAFFILVYSSYFKAHITG